MPDAIEKTINLNAPLGRVWQAITDSEEFGTWFKVKLEGPFVVGEKSFGQITHPGYEHLRWEADVVTMEPERRFALRWCPYGGDPKVDYSDEPQTLVEFILEATATGTKLIIRESGFDQVPAERRDAAFRDNSGGWDHQESNIRAHVEN